MSKKPVRLAEKTFTPQPPKVRSVSDIQQEYSQTLIQLGSAVHNLEQGPGRIDRLKERLRSLDVEGEEAMRQVEIEQKKRAEEERLKAEAAEKAKKEAEVAEKKA